MLKKMNEKKNNKGFSLVELIVVILIMAVLAVALAPQVMKWVGNARLANDKQSVETIVSGAQLALAQEGATGYDLQILYTPSNATPWAVTRYNGATGDPKPKKASIDAVLGSGWDAKLKSSEITSVKISASGASITVEYTPSTVFDNLK